MAGYLGAIPVPQATQNRESFTCSANQTSFATLNGVRLNTADFTATNGSDISGEAASVQAIANAAWTDDVKAAYKAMREAQG